MSGRPKRGKRELAVTLKALRDYGWNVSWAAWALGEDRANLYRRLRRLRINPTQWRLAEPQHAWWGRTLKWLFKRRHYLNDCLNDWRKRK